MTMTQPKIQRLARDLLGLDRRVRSLEFAPQLGWSSMDDAAIKLYIDGLLKGYFGRLPDGSPGVLPVNAKKPPAPTGLTVEGVPGGLMVRWPALFGDEIMPMDFSRVEVHVSTEADFAADMFDTLVTSIESPRGGEVFVRILDTEQRFVRLVARNTSGAASVASAVVSGTPMPEQIDKPTTFYGADPPPNPEVNFIWFKAPDNSPHRWSGTAWEQITDQVAIDAAEQAAQAAVSANSKNRVYYLPAAPGGTFHVTDDIWFNTANGYALSRWDGSSWVLSELGHQAMSSLDLGKATVGMLSARKISTGVLVAGATLKAGGHDSEGNLLWNGNRVEMNDTGIKLVRRTNGVDETRVHLNTGTGSGFFKGELSGATGTFSGDLFASRFTSGSIELTMNSTRLEISSVYSASLYATPAITWNSGNFINPHITASGRSLFFTSGATTGAGATFSAQQENFSWTLYGALSMQLNSTELTVFEDIFASARSIRAGTWLSTGNASPLYLDGGNGTYGLRRSSSFSSVLETVGFSSMSVAGGTVLTSQTHSHGTPPIIQRANNLYWFSSGKATIPHNLGFTPNGVSLNGGIPGRTVNLDAAAVAGGIDSSNIYVTMTDASGANVPNGNHRVTWIAVG